MLHQMDMGEVWLLLQVEIRKSQLADKFACKITMELT